MGNAGKLIIVILLAGLVGAFVHFDGSQYLNLDYVKSQQAAFLDYYQANTFKTIAVFMLIYIGSTALSLPGATVLTLLAGALFGALSGTIIVSFASTIGATLAFLTARFLIGNTIQARYGDRLRKINQGVEKDGAFYLFTLRLVPAFPFFVINLVMGLTPIRTVTYFFVSQIGMLPGTFVYVNAGTQLSQIDSFSGILSPSVVASFVALGVFPIIAKKIIVYIKSKKANQGA